MKDHDVANSTSHSQALKYTIWESGRPFMTPKNFVCMQPFVYRSSLYSHNSPAGLLQLNVFNECEHIIKKKKDDSCVVFETI